jgi:hypothetical protein
MEQALRNLTTQLHELEISICKSIIVSDADDTVQLLKKSATARNELTSAADTVNEELREHIAGKNKHDAGTISWIKQGKKLGNCPDAINFKETMKYLFDHEQFESDGYQLYDFYAETVDEQFEKIIALLNGRATISSRAPSETKTLCHAPYERLKRTYFPGGMDQTNIDYSKFVESMAPIIQTSVYMLEQVVSGSIKVSHSEG